jgi:hypothetical protein
VAAVWLVDGQRLLLGLRLRLRLGFELALLFV